MAEKPVAYGGQAVVEGVMFGGRHAQVTAIRRKDHRIETYEVIKKQSSSAFIQWIKKIPFLRGIVALIQASSSGAKHLQFAADRYDLDETSSDEEMVEQKPSRNSKVKTVLGVAVVGVLSFILGKMLFTALPAFLASILFDRFISNLIVQNLIEGGIKTLLLLDIC